MKTTIKLLTLAFVLFATACNNDDEMDMLNSLWRNVTQNEARIDALEKWCAQANTNISSLQTIVNVFESNDAITSIAPVMEGGVEIGYTITFSNHDPITIYHGKDGKDGQNGANGQNGASPIVGVAQSGGVYYWTINGEWLLDADGNKLPVSGKDGANGENGQNGSNGQNGVTPQLKIENDYWWISYDNGSTWTQLGKAKGEDGENGQNGAKGDRGDKGDAGDSMFQSVTQDADNVYFTLSDGTVITIAKGSGGADQPNSDFIFTITYMPNGGEGEIIKDTVCYGNSYTLRVNTSFTKEGYYFVIWNTKSDGTGLDYPGKRVMNVITRNITFYAKWVQEGVPYAVDLGLSVKWASFNVGASSPEEYGSYFAWGETSPKSNYNSSTYTYLSNPTTLPLNKDAAAVNMGGSWRMPTKAEQDELLSKCTWEWTTNYNGTGVAGLIGTSKINGNSIFLPAAGYRDDSDLSRAGSNGYYWSSSLYTSNSSNAYSLYFSSGDVYWGSYYRYYGRSVRGVCK